MRAPGFTYFAVDCVISRQVHKATVRGELEAGRGADAAVSAGEEPPGAPGAERAQLPRLLPALQGGEFFLRRKFQR